VKGDLLLAMDTGHNIAFTGIEFHAPNITPPFKRVQISL